MKKVFLTMAAIGAMAVAAPAAAQSWNAGGTVGISNRIAQLETRIEAGIRSGEINRTERRALRRELYELRQLERQYAVNGFSREERTALQARIRDLRHDFRTAVGARAYARYGWDDDDGDYATRVDRNRDGWDDRDLDRDGRWEDDEDVYATRVDRNRDGWDDRDLDRDGRWEDDVQGRGGPYEDPYDYPAECRERGGIGAVLDRVLGGNDDCGTTLRVGARATGNLGPVPSSLRYRYRDGGGVYYRSDGRAVYQIDARTHTVLRIYDID